MELSLGELARLLGTEVRGKHRAGKGVTLCTDSRALKRGQVFWALKGENFDGHGFVEDTFARGGYAAVVDADWLEKNGRPVNVYMPVKDTNAALLSLAQGYAGKFRIPKIAVTGSNGKTTTKDMIVRVLSLAGPVLGTQGNFNNHVGVPLTLFELKKNHRSAVIEMGTNHPGEIKVLTETARPTMAVITNIGDSHLEHFGSKERVLEEKLHIADGLQNGGVLVLNVDDPLLAEVKTVEAHKLVTFGIDRGQIRASDLVFGPDGCASFRVGRTAFRLRVPGRHNVYNALAAIAVGTRLRIPKGLMSEALAGFAASKNRMQVKRLPMAVTVLDDCYNANPSSMKSALSTLGGYRPNGRRIAILGDMLELGDRSESLHAEIGHYLMEMGVDELFTFGTLSRHINRGAREKGMPRKLAHHFSDFDLMCGELSKSVGPGDVILIKASRGMRLERVYEFLWKQAATGSPRTGERT